MKKLAALTILLGLTTTTTAFAQTFCNERQGIVKYLGKSHAEQPVAMGLVSNGSMLEILASEKGTWTIIVTKPNGVSCVVSAGEAWESMAVRSPEEPGT